MRRTVRGLGTTVGSAALAAVVILGVGMLTSGHQDQAMASAPRQAAGVSAVAPAAVVPQAQRFLAVAGIQGEATFKGYSGQIEVHGAAWSVSDPISLTNPNAKSHLGELTVNYVYDRSVPQLEAAAASGRAIATAVLTETDGRGGPVLVEKLTAVHVVAVSVSGAAGGTTQVQVTLTADQRETDYSGAPGGGVVRSCWNERRNAAC